MSRYKIRLDTQSDVCRFVDAVSGLPKKVYLTDNSNFRVSGSSLLGALYTMEWENVWVESEMDIYRYVAPFIINE